jgi:hypothetical protein
MRKMTFDEENKSYKSDIPKHKKKPGKASVNWKKKFEMLMNTGGELEIEMRLMDSRLRKINKEWTKKKKKKGVGALHLDSLVIGRK